MGERKLKLNVEKKKFLARLERDMILKPSVWNQNETEKLVKEVKSTLYHPIDHIRGNEIIISNFRFKRERKNNGHWIIDGITVKKENECLTAREAIRMKTRMMLSLASGYKFVSVLRLDYLSDIALIILICSFPLLMLKSSIDSREDSQSDN